MLSKENISQKSAEAISNLIDEEEKKKNQTVEEIRNTIAIYQGQATLGKIINIVLHEGRRPLNFFKNQRDNLLYYKQKFSENHDAETADKILSITEGYNKNGETFSKLFSRLDPLASRRRDTKRAFPVRKVFDDVIAVFEMEIANSNITVNVDCADDVIFDGWEQDFYTIFTNLIDNSIYWMNQRDSASKEIHVHVSQEGFLIDYQDSGPGINQELIESGVIFEPEFSTKTNGGSGLGLAIAGEAAERNALELKAIWSDKGAHFTLQRKED